MDNFDVLIDDSMWGYPIGGTLMGVYRKATDSFQTKEVPVKYFQSPMFERKKYLDEIAKVSLEMVKNLEVAKNEKILICTGYCNNGIEPLLRKNGYKNVRRGKIGEPLQTYLEDAAKKYIKEVYGCDYYYDPKCLSKQQISTAFYSVIGWIKSNNRFNDAKTGWKFFKNKCRIK